MRNVAKNKKAVAAIAVSIFVAVIILSSSFTANGNGQNISRENSHSSPYTTNNIAVKESSIESRSVGSSASPIGIADAGVSANGSYSYSSTSFLGKIGINQLEVSGSQGKIYHFSSTLTSNSSTREAHLSTGSRMWLFSTLLITTYIS